MRKGVVVAIAMLFAVCVAAALSSAAPVRESHSGWTWGNPRPQGHTLRAVEFAGADGYASGDFGTLLKTDDGGSTWSGLRTASTVALSKLRVVDADTLLAGGGCTLLRSDDGGQTLRALRFTATRGCAAPLVSFSFVSSDVGYLLRSDRTVLRTTDGGATFTARTALPGGAPGPVNDIWFTSADDGVAVTGADVSGQILRTTDGGEHWTVKQSTRAVKSVFFVNDTTGFAVGDGVVLKTIDGGDTWTPQPDPGAILNSVRCFDEMHCVLVTSGNIVLYTSDGFATLQHSTRADGDAESTVPALAAAFSSITRAVAVGDEGDTWTSDSDGAAFDRGYISPLKALSRLRTTSSSVAHAAGANGKVARTTDGGASWSEVGVPTTNDIVDVTFPTADNGWAVDTSGALFRTDNGGGSWAILGQPVPPNPQALYHLLGDPTMQIVGSFGLLRSTDGGQTFNKVPGKAGSRSYIGIDGSGGTVALAFGPKTLALTSNGKSWRLLKRPKGSSFVADVDFISKSTGYLLDVDGRLWKTTNGANRWRKQLAVGTAGGYDISFTGAKQGYLAMGGWAGMGGSFGWVLHTSNGGGSWRPQLVDNRDVRSIAAASGSNAFTLTNGDHLFHTSTGGDAASPSSLTSKAQGLTKHRVRSSGRLLPAVAGGARVAVLWRIGKEQKWHHKFVTTGSDGRFSTTIKDRKSDPPIAVVVQWAGNQALRSAGSLWRQATPKQKPVKVEPAPGPPTPKIATAPR